MNKIQIPTGWTIEQAAELAVYVTESTGVSTRFQFNQYIIMANPGDSDDCVLAKFYKLSAKSFHH